MDKLKDILKQAIKHRFWIAVAVAALVPLIAYFTAAGSIRAEATKQAAEIKSKYEAVKGVSPAVPNTQYTDIVKEKTTILKAEVDKTWRTLYDRQAPLLTWPKSVEDAFPAWGRASPKNVDSSAIQAAINEYVYAYPAYVKDVYQTFHPFDTKEGTGIVAAPPEAELLMTPEFKIQTPPSLKQIWDVQERLWLQRAVLQVIAETNAGAKDWDSAPIKQITMLDVATTTAQDQMSATSKENKLTKTEEILPEGAEKPEAADTSSPMGMMMAMGGMGGAKEKEKDIMFEEGPGGQYKLYPIALGVYIEQDQILHFLDELRKSPMIIHVKEVEISKPEGKVVKPTKNSEYAFGNIAMMGGGMMGMGRGTGTAGTRAMMAMMGKMYGSSGPGGGMTSGPGGGGMNPDMMAAMMRGGPMGMGLGPTVARKGRDIRDKTAAKKSAKDKEKDKEEPPAEETPAESANQYLNVVQFTIYGQARIYNKPPEPTPTESEGTPKPEAPAETKPDAAPAAETKPDAAPAPAAEAKPDAAPAPAAETKPETPPKPEAPTAKPETPPSEPKQADAPAPKP